MLKIFKAQAPLHDVISICLVKHYHKDILHNTVLMLQEGTIGPFAHLNISHKQCI